MSIEAPKGLGKRATIWWNKLREDQQKVFPTLTPDAQKAIIDLTKSWPGPKRHELIQLGGSHDPINIFLWTLILDSGGIYNKVSLSFEDALAYAKAIAPYRKRIKKKDVRYPSPAFTAPSSPPPTRRKWGEKLNPELIGKIPIPGTSHFDSHIVEVAEEEVVPHIVDILDDVHSFMIEKAPQSEAAINWLKAFLKDIPDTNKNVEPAAEKLLALDPRLATLTIITDYHPSIGARLKKSLSGKPMTLDVMGRLKRSGGFL